MSETVELMLDGVICQNCGSFIDGIAPGFPRSCGCDGEYIEGICGTENDFFLKTSKKKKPKCKKK